MKILLDLSQCNNECLDKTLEEVKRIYKSNIKQSNKKLLKMTTTPNKDTYVRVEFIDKKGRM